MKRILIAAFLFTSISSFSQSEQLVPKDAISVFSIDNVSLLQKISLDELIKYEFMEEVQQEIFDGSTNNKTLKESGIDFDQRMNIFQGKSADFTITGFSFGVSDRIQLFDVFDDYQPIESDYSDVDIFSSYFNRVAIRGNSAVLFRVNPHYDLVTEITDSIWYARGNDYPWYYYEEEAAMESVEMIEEETEVEFFEDMELEENTSNPIELDELPIAEADPTEKTYYELRDSIEAVLHTVALKKVCDELFITNETLASTDAKFAEQLTHSSEGIFYLDNSRNFRKTNMLWNMSSMYSRLLEDVEELYKDNIIVGDLVLNDEKVDLQLTMNYGEKLGSIYEEMTDTKFDKNVLKYIHKENNGFFTYNINLRKAYEQAYDVIVPMLTDAGAPLAGNLLTIELLDELLNKDAIFGVYQGSMFGSYHGIQKVKTKKIVFDYNDETFEYTEREEEAEEDMPVFSMGFTTERSDIPERVLERVSAIVDELHNEGDYWVIDNAVLDAAPLYILLKNDLFILTNDADLAKNNSDGYGSNAISRAQGKKAKKSGVMYGFADLKKAIENIPRGIFSDQENELLDVVRGKSGELEISSSSTTRSKTDMRVTYSFDETVDTSGTYILDLINSLYVISK